MFYSDAILSRRGPLGRVWLAAHMERKLSKSQTLQTDIEQSVDAIMGQEIEVMALRLSGQLLLGVVRIYSRKAKYLLDDCNEALLKIKMAFRPGVVDLTEDQLTVNKTAITLQTSSLGLDLLLPDVNWDMDFEERTTQRHGHHQAHIDDITLRTADDFQQFDINDPFDIGPSDGIGSQDFNEVDLGIHWDDEAAQGAQGDKSDLLSNGDSVGVARHAPHLDDSFDLGIGDAGQNFDIFSHKSLSRAGTEPPFGGEPMDIDNLDLGDLGIGFDDMPMDSTLYETPGQTRESSRASSPLTELPLTPPPMEDVMDVTIADEGPAELQKTKRKPKDKKQIIDTVTEIQNGALAKNGRGKVTAASNPVNTDVTSITAEQNFLPRSSVVMRLMEIRNNPIAHFMPTHTTPEGTFLCTAPPGLSAELAKLFIRPIQGTQKRKALSPPSSPNKRSRQQEEPEQGRRLEGAPDDLGDAIQFDQGTPGFNADFEFPDQSGIATDYQLEVPEVEGGLDGQREKSVVSDRSRSRMSTPGLLDEPEMSYGDMNCPISIFDSRHASQLQSQSENVQPEAAEPDKHGYSKNTVTALALIRKELQPADAQDKVLSFQQLSSKASRRAAASFFFELLVLGTRDCVRLSQQAPLDNIEFTGKPRLWEHQQASQGEVGP